MGPWLDAARRSGHPAPRFYAVHGDYTANMGWAGYAPNNDHDHALVDMTTRPIRNICALIRGYQAKSKDISAILS